ncbi:hypothetical protein Ahy_B02g058001 isoform B [Arachis hypogaea]|uniref:Uncharacterized protein n=1 Tax=Arachis hypogaea TaxID=3818 RepID=A0A445ADJ9_ARAHY|nr:hypothetical protein Ahy_B02g058001 isoform B [Arachis hypogaea]
MSLSIRGALASRDSISGTIPFKSLSLKHSERGFFVDSVALAKQIWKVSKLESLEASIEAAFEAIRSRGTNSHVGEFKCLLGAKPTLKKELIGAPIVTHPKSLKLPKEFDTRTQWSQCSTIGTIIVGGESGRRSYSSAKLPFNFKCLLDEVFNDVPSLLQQHIVKGEIIDSLWRGQMALSEDEQIKSQEQRFLLNGLGSFEEGNAMYRSEDNSGGCCQTNLNDDGSRAHNREKDDLNHAMSRSSAEDLKRPNAHEGYNWGTDNDDYGKAFQDSLNSSAYPPYFIC